MTDKVLLSVLAAGVTPVVAYAQTVTDKLEVTAFELDKDATKDCSVTLVTGEYTITGEGTFKVSTDGGKNFNSTVNVSVSGTKTVNFKIKNTGDKATSKYTITWTLSSEQQSKLTNLTDRVVAIINTTQASANTDALADLNTKASALAAKLAGVPTVWADYQAFVAGDLEAELGTLEGQINTATLNYERYIKVKDELSDLDKKLKAAWDDTYKTEYAISLCEELYKEIKGEIAKHADEKDGELVKAYNENKAWDKYSETEWKKISDEISGKIKTLQTNIMGANSNNDAYNAIAPLIGPAKEAHAKAVQEIIALLGQDSVYDDWLKQAQGELNELYNNIIKAEKNNGTAENHDNAAATRAENEKLLDGIVAKIEKVFSDWTTKHADQVAAYNAAKKKQGELNDELKKANVAGIPAEAAEKVKTVQGEIDQLLADIESYNKAHTIIAKADDLAKEYAKISSAIDEINKIAAADIANYNANEANTKLLAGIQKSLDDAKAAVGKLESKDKKYTATRYESTATKLQKDIDDLKDGAKKAYEEKKATAWEAGNKAGIDAAKAAIAQYEADAKASLAKYDATVAALADYDAAYSKLVSVVTLDATTTCTYEKIGSNLITNGNFDNGLTGWTAGDGKALSADKFEIVTEKETGNKYLKAKDHGGVDNAASIATAWNITPGNRYALSFRYKDTDGQYIKVSLTTEKGKETNVINDGNYPAKSSGWSTAEYYFDAEEYTFVQARFRWLNKAACFDDFELRELVRTKTNTTTYGQEKDRLAKEIQALRDALAKALEADGADHTAAMTALDLNSKIKADCDTYAAQYKVDKKAYDAVAEQTAINNLKTSANNKTEKIQNKINLLGFTADKEADTKKAVGVAYDDIKADIDKLQAQLNTAKANANNANSLALLTQLTTELASIEEAVDALTAENGSITVAKAKVTANNEAKKTIDPLYDAVNKELNGETDKDGKVTYTALEDINIDATRSTEFGADSKLVTGYDAELAAIAKTISESYAAEELPSKMESNKVGNYTNSEKVLDNKRLVLDAATTLDPKKDIIPVAAGVEFYLYNTEAGGFFTGSNAWGTHAAVTPDASKALKVRFTPVGDGKYRLENYGNSKGNKWMNTMAESQDAIYVDGASQPGQETWMFTPAADGTFTISNSIREGLFSAGANGNAGVPDLVFSTEANARNKWVAVANCSTGMSVKVGKDNTKGWKEQQEGAFMQADAGWGSLEMTDFTMKKEVTLSKGMYRLTVPAFYRQGGGYDDVATVNAYLIAGDKKIKVKNIAATGAADDGQAWSKIKDGSCNNVIEFEVTEDSKTISVGFEGTHNVARSWFVTGNFTLEKASKIDVVKSIPERIEDLQAQVTKSRKDAQASTDNYKAKEEALAYIAEYGKTDKVAGVSVEQRITNAVAALSVDDKDKDGKVTAPAATGANLEYWTKYLTANGEKDKSCTKTLAAINADIEKFYGKDNRNMVEKLGSIKARVDELVRGINKAVTDAKEAEQAHNDQLELWDKVQKEWIDAYYDLSTKDESSHLTTDQNTMAGFQTDLNKIKKDMEDIFAKGESKTKDKTDDLNDISTKIADLLKTWSKNYNEYIAADNEQRYDDFQKTVASTSATFTEAINTMNDYSKLKNEELQDVITENLKETHDAIYEYATKIRELKNEAKESYGNVEAGEVWDEAAENKTQAEEYTKEINDALALYTTGVNDAAAELYLDKKAEVESAYSYEDVIRFAPEAHKDAFKDIDDILAAADEAIAKNEDGTYKHSNTLATDISKYLDQLQNYEAMIAADREAAAKKHWDDFCDQYSKRIAEESANFEEYGVDVEAYNEMVENSLNAAKAEAAKAEAANTLYDQIYDLQQMVEANWNANIYENAKKAYENDQARDEAKDNVIAQAGEVQKELNALTTWAADLRLANQYADEIAALQFTLDQILKENSGYNEEALTKRLETLSDDIEDAKEKILVKEFAALQNAIEVLKTEYNNAAAANMDDATLDDYKVTIAEYEDEREAIKESIDPTEIDPEDIDLDKTKNDCAALEVKIAQTQSELAAKYNDGKSAAQAIAALNQSLEAVKAANQKNSDAVDGLNEPVAKKYKNNVTKATNTIASVNAAVASIEAEMAEYGTAQILTYKDIVAEHIAAAASAANSINNSVEFLVYTDKANEKAKADADANIKAVEDAVEAAKATINKFANVKADNYQSNFDDINFEIEVGKEEVEYCYSEVLSQTFDNTDLLSEVDYIVKDATYNDLRIAANTDHNEINSLRDTYLYGKGSNDYPEGVYTQLWKMYSAMQSKPNNINYYNDSMYWNGGYDVDIEGKYLDEYVAADYMTEVVPVVKEALAGLAEEIAAFKALAEESSYILGDADADGVVDINDYNTVISHILKRQIIENGTKAFRGADVNKDGEVRVGDATSIISIIKQSYGVMSMAKARARYTENTDAISVAATDNGTTQRLAISLDNTRSYVAFQMDITLPEGVTLAQEGVGARAEALDLHSNDIENGVHRVVLASANNNLIEGNEGAILYLDLNVSSSYAGGAVLVDNIEAVDAQNRSYILGSASTDQATGIHTVTMMQDVKNRIYNVGGQLMNGIKKGVNIIVGEDGSAKKVVKK